MHIHTDRTTVRTTKKKTVAQNGQMCNRKKGRTMSKYDRKVCILIVCMTAGLNEIPSESFNEKKKRKWERGKKTMNVWCCSTLNCYEFSLTWRHVTGIAKWHSVNDTYSKAMNCPLFTVMREWEWKKFRIVFQIKLHSNYLLACRRIFPQTL